MKKIITGVYKIENIKTQEKYIGCSSNIEERWKAHQKRFLNELSKEYYKPLYTAMREHGIESFTFEVLEELDSSLLREKEKFYINFFNSEKAGYNQTNKLEGHGMAKLTIEDVVNIRTRYNNLETKKNVYIDYICSISEKGFHKIWNGYTWKEIMPEVYSEENKCFHKNNTGNVGECNGRTALTDCDVLYIRQQKKQGKKPEFVFKDFSLKITYRSFLNTWYGYNWKHLTA